MSTIPITRAANLVTTLALCLTLISCSGGDDAGVKPATSNAADSELTRTLAQFESVNASPGTIEGLVVFDGVPPARVAIDTSAEGGCGMDPNQPARTEAWVVDQARFANVFVWLENPPGDPAARTVPSEPLTLRQRGCVYRPHALGLRTGQKLLITNEDRARHNVHALPRRNPDFNLSQSEGAPPIEVVFGVAENPLPIVCDLHPWMKAWVGVFDHPYFAVSGADGRFSWSGLPSGEYQLHAWHEVLGKMTASAKLSENAGAKVCITFHPKP